MPAYIPNSTPEIYTGSNVIDAYADAQAALAKVLPFTEEPVLSDAVVGKLLDDAKRCTVWTASTEYNIGDEVLPTRSKRTGRRYKLVVYQQGTTRITSNASEPVWPVGQGEVIGDGEGVWMENGPEKDCWDINAAAQDGWIKKAGTAASCFDKTVQGNTYRTSQVFDHYEKMIKLNAPVDIG